MSRVPLRPQFGLTLLRIVTGAGFFMHGYQKVVEMGIAKLTGGFSQWHLPVPTVTAPLVAVLEFLGGIALVLGLLTRLVALGFIIEMLGAILFVHISFGFFGPRGFELPLLYCAASAALLLGGPGRYSIDGMIAARRVRRVL